MKTVELVEVWNDRQRYFGSRDHIDLGVNWSAVGPVSPTVARRFAKQILKAADKVETLKAAYEKKGRCVHIC